MRPPHVVPAIAVTPARLLALLLIALTAALLALAIQRRRVQLAKDVAEESLARLRGFHLFGPDDDELPHVHVPMLRARPGSSPAPRPPVPGSPAATLRSAAPVATALAPAPVATAPAAPHAVTPAVAPAPAPPAPRPIAATRQPAPSASVATASAAATSAPATATRPAVPKPAARNGTPRRQPAASSPPWDTPRPTRASADPPSAPQPRSAPPSRATSRDLNGRPAPRPERTERPRPDAANPDGDILLVEDDTMIASMYQTLLGTRGYEVRHAQDGVEGVAMVRDRLPALILLDMMMPRMDGIQFLEALRGWPRTRSIPVVVLSNVGDRHLVERAMSLGAVEYLVKAQTRPQVLLGALPHWLRGNRALTTLS